MQFLSDILAVNFTVLWKSSIVSLLYSTLKENASYFTISFGYRTYISFLYLYKKFRLLGLGVVFRGSGIPQLRHSRFYGRPENTDMANLSNAVRKCCTILRRRSYSRMHSWHCVTPYVCHRHKAPHTWNYKFGRRWLLNVRSYLYNDRQNEYLKGHMKLLWRKIVSSTDSTVML